MGLRRFPANRILLQAAWRIALCILLAAAAVFAVQFIRRMRETPEPFLEIFRTQPETHASAIKLYRRYQNSQDKP
jgi:hypothetical protein